MSTRLRILELIKSLDVGGAEMLLLERLRVADRLAFDYAVGWLDPGRTDLVPSFEALGVPMHCFPAASVVDWRWLRPLRRHLLDRRVDVVHVHSPLMAAGVRAVVRSLRPWRPALLTTEHSPTHHPLTLLLDQMTVRADDFVVAVSAAVRASVVCRTAPRVATVHHGVNRARLADFRRDRDRLSAEFGLAPGPRVVSVANYRAEKGHRTLLAAARLVHAAAPEVHFYVAGQGPLAGWVRSEVERHAMAGYFHVFDRVPTAARLSACADVFVLCSDYEGRPVALMEALGAGVPAVVTATGGMPDLVRPGDNGCLVPPGDPRALAGTLLPVLRDEALRTRLSAGALRSATGFDMVDTASALEFHYRRLDQGRKAGHGK
jgi:glycosyltransferase involved in cell wall biosynthesis